VQFYILNKPLIIIIIITVDNRYKTNGSKVARNKLKTVDRQTAAVQIYQVSSNKLK
jgi:hypothetical protein